MFRLSHLGLAALLAATIGCGTSNSGSDAAPSAQKPVTANVAATQTSNTPTATAATAGTAGTTGSADTGASGTTGSPPAQAANTDGDSAAQYGPDDPETKRFFPLSLLKKSTVSVGDTKIPVWVMETDAERNEGLMYLKDKDVPDKNGMIFVFDSEADRSFWMENTFIPLDIVYIRADGSVVNVGEGKALSTDNVKSKGKSKYVLELKAGMAAKFGIKPGVKIDIPSTLQSQEPGQ